MDSEKKPQKIGYVRISTDYQTTVRQLEGIELDKTFSDIKSGKTLNRRGLQDMIQYCRPGDTIFVHSLDRLARNLRDLKNLIYDLNKKGIKVNFVKERLLFEGNETPLANLLLNIMGAVAEFERAIIRERILEGIAIAKKKGVYKGRKRVFNFEQSIPIVKRIKNGEKKTLLSREYGIGRATLLRYERDYDKLFRK